MSAEPKRYYLGRGQWITDGDLFCSRCLMAPHSGECQPFQGNGTITMTGQERAAAERRAERSKKGWEPMDPGDTRDLWKAGE